MSKITHFLLLIGLFSNFALQAMDAEQRQRIEQGIRGLNVNQVRQVLGELNNNLAQEESNQLWGILNNLPERNHRRMALSSGENGIASLIGSSAFGFLSGLFYMIRDPKSKEQIKNLFEKFAYYIPVGASITTGTVAGALFLLGLYFYGKDLKYTLSANRYSKVFNVLENAHIQ